MNTVAPEFLPTLAVRLLCLLAPVRSGSDGASPVGWLSAQAGLLADPEESPERLVECCLNRPLDEDRELSRLARALSLNVSECMALALCHAGATNAHASRALAWLQGGGHGPSPGLLASKSGNRPQANSGKGWRSPGA